MKGKNIFKKVIGHNIFNFLCLILNSININKIIDNKIIAIKKLLTTIYNNVAPFNSPVKLKFRKKSKSLDINLF